MTSNGASFTIVRIILLPPARRIWADRTCPSPLLMSLSMIAVRQKPRRNDGSTMSTTSPSSGCFSVALLLLTIFLDSLRASKYCSVQIVQSSCRYPGLNSNTHTNEPPIPRTQFEYDEPPIPGTQF
ncbi:hypothetical protein V9T40_013521 [Parthenolecanium corni]|uniref:Uncharacterized protein n=1 Tax=Parthenolecanium corni TaxID=536013 RepID=A0AAN9TFH3_9HEMI